MHSRLNSCLSDWEKRAQQAVLTANEVSRPPGAGAGKAGAGGRPTTGRTTTPGILGWDSSNCMNQKKQQPNCFNIFRATFAGVQPNRLRDSHAVAHLNTRRLSRLEAWPPCPCRACTSEQRRAAWVFRQLHTNDGKKHTPHGSHHRLTERVFSPGC